MFRLSNTYHLEAEGHQPWIIWKTINRSRAVVAKNKRKRDEHLEGPDVCESDEIQSDEYLLQYALAPAGCTIDDFHFLALAKYINILFYFIFYFHLRLILIPSWIR